MDRLSILRWLSICPLTLRLKYIRNAEYKDVSRFLRLSVAAESAAFRGESPRRGSGGAGLPRAFRRRARDRQAGVQVDVGDPSGKADTREIRLLDYLFGRIESGASCQFLY